MVQRLLVFSKSAGNSPTQAGVPAVAIHYTRNFTGLKSLRLISLPGHNTD